MVAAFMDTVDQRGTTESREDAGIDAPDERALVTAMGMGRSHDGRSVWLQ